MYVCPTIPDLSYNVNDISSCFRNKVTLYKQCPPYFLNSNNLNDLALSTRSKNVTCSKSNNQFGDRRLFCDAVRMWNSLPLGLRSIENNKLFKVKLKCYLLDLQSYL